MEERGKEEKRIQWCSCDETEGNKRKIDKRHCCQMTECWGKVQKVRQKIELGPIIVTLNQLVQFINYDY